MLAFEDPVVALACFVLTAFLLFETGFLVAVAINKSWVKHVVGTQILLMIPVCVTLGLVAYSTILFFVGLVYYGPLLLTVSVTLTTIVFLIVIYKLKEEVNFSAHRWLRAKNLLSLIVLMVSNIYLILVLAVFVWPPPGDIINHGFYLSLIIENGHIPQSFSPFTDLNFKYPVGFHVVAGVLSMAYQIYPGEAILLLGAILAANLLTMVYFLSLETLRSHILAALSYLSLFFTYPNMERWVMGFVFNGPYPNLYAFLVLALSLYSAVSFASKGEPDGILGLSPFLRIFTLLGLAMVLVYPAFVVPLGIIFIAALEVNGIGVRGALSRISGDAWSLLGLVPLVYATTYVFFQTVIPDISTGVTGSALPYYQIPLELLTESVIGYSVLAAFVIGVLLMLQRQVFSKPSRTEDSCSYRQMLVVNLVFIVIAAICFLSMIEGFYEMLVVFLPDRLFVVLVIFAWITIFLNLKHIISRESANEINESSSLRTDKSQRLVAWLIVIVIAVAAFMPGVYGNLSLNEASARAWYSRSDHFDDGFAVLEWTVENTPDDALILNDASWLGLFTWSLAIKNISTHYVLRARSDNMTYGLFDVWLHPDNESKVFDLLQRYNVSYIVSTADPYYFDFLGTQGLPAYRAKPFSPERYIEIFSSYPYLQPVFISGNASLFRFVP